MIITPPQFVEAAALIISVALNGLFIETIKEKNASISALEYKHVPWNKGKAGTYKLGKRKGKTEVKVHLVEPVVGTIGEYADYNADYPTLEQMGREFKAEKLGAEAGPLTLAKKIVNGELDHVLPQGEYFAKDVVADYIREHEGVETV